ncbi:HEAT repeat domain-containing protein [Trichothermofontia sp.]
MTQLVPLAPPTPSNCRRLYQHLCSLSPSARANPPLEARDPEAAAAPPNTPDAPPTPERVLHLALSLLDQGDFHTRWQVAKLLPELGEIAIAPLVERLANLDWADDDEADWDLPWFIARILGEIKHPTAVVALVNLLQTTPHPDVASMAALALANMGAIVLPRLVELLRSPATRSYAVQTLAHLQTPAAINLLVQVTADPSPQIRAMAIEALSRLPVANLAAILLPALHDPDGQVQRVAIIAAGLQASQLPEAPLVAALQTHLLTGESDVAQQAAIALGRLGTPAAVEALTAGLFQPLPLAQARTIVRELARIASEPALAALATYLFDCPTPALLPPLDVIAVSQEIARLLGQVDTATAQAQAAAILLCLLTATDHPACQAPYAEEILPVIALSLAHLGHTPAIAPLRQHLDRASDRCRLHLLSALKQLETTPSATPAS